MKKTIILLFILAITAVAYAGSQKPFEYPFIGKWNPSDPAELLDKLDLQDIQNLRKWGRYFRGVSGHTKANTTVIDSTYIYPQNGIHYKKNKHEESHVLLFGKNAGDTAGYIYDDSSEIGTQGSSWANLDFTSVDKTGDYVTTGTGRFSTAPQESIVYCDDRRSLIWGGDEMDVLAFYTASAEIDDRIIDARDSSAQIKNLNPEDVAIINGYDAVLLLHMDGSDGSSVFTDSSTGGGGSPHTVTRHGSAVIDIDQFKFGNASARISSAQGADTDYLSVPDSPDWNLGSGLYTIDFWIYISPLIVPTNYDGGVFEQASDATNYTKCFYDGVFGDYIRFIKKDAGERKNAIHSAEITGGVWQHIAIIMGWGGVADTLAICTNGQVSEIETGASDWPDYTSPFCVGLNPTGSTSNKSFPGWIDDFRVIKGAAVWTENFVPPERAGVESGFKHFLVGVPRPVDGFKVYVGGGNSATAPALSGKAWDGASWTPLVNLVDNTAGLDVTGTVTFDSTVFSSKKKLIENLSLFWYQFELSAGQSTIYHVTADAPLQKMTNIWNGDEIPSAACRIDNTDGYEDALYQVSAYRDTLPFAARMFIPAIQDSRNSKIKSWRTELNYTYNVGDDVESTVLALDNLPNAQAVLVGFTERASGINFKIPRGKGNTNTNTMVVKYWNGNSFTPVSGLVDGTASGVDALYESGIVSWQPPEEREEFPLDLSGDYPFYYYEVSFGSQLDGETEIYYITGIPAASRVDGYRFSVEFQNRVLLFNAALSEGNVLRYSAFNTPYIFNGEDSGELVVGSGDLISAAPIYNLYNQSGVHQLILCNNYETFRLTGEDASEWSVEQISGNVGCVAPLSMAVCDISSVSETPRHVAVWQSAGGVVMTDGATIRIISDPVRKYWDDTSAGSIPDDRKSASFGWYDKELRSYKLLISSGAGQSTHNVELEYSLKNDEWTKIHRENGVGANPLQVGFPVRDASGNNFSYGGTNEGYIYNTEDGNTWDGTGIAEYLQTKDIMLDPELPFLTHTRIDLLRLGLREKTTASTEDISIDHYCNGVLSVNGTGRQRTLADIDMADGRIKTQDCYLGECLYHSLKFSCTASTVSHGMELTGMGLLFESYKGIFYEE